MSRRKRNIRIAFAITAAYAAVLVLLLAAESKAEGASIKSLGDAIWYSVITLTTVGYGDISPVTPMGKVLGIALALCSLGVFTALIGVLINYISGQARPRRRLRARDKHKWYAINEENEQSVHFAESVWDDDPDAVIIFRHSKEKLIIRPNIVRIDCSPEELIDLKGGSQNIMYLCMGEDSWENYRQATDAAGLGIDTYCLTDFGVDGISEKLHTFSRKETVSRCYWRDHPVKRDEKTIVLIGSGSIATELLERCLLTNVFEPGRFLSYHIFGDSSEFRKSHREAVRTLCGGDPEDDALFLHEECWEYHPEIIRNADRIIICEDDDSRCLTTFKELMRLFPTAADIHVRLNGEVDKARFFGSSRDVFKMSSFVRVDINDLAVMLNDIYNEKTGGSTGWHNLDDHLKRSNVAAADHMIVKVRYLLKDDSITELTENNCREAYELFESTGPQEREVCREMEHRRWLRFHQMYNWTYSPDRDDKMRRHPLMLPYKELSEEDKEKDDIAWEMLAGVADRSAV
ncbi:MAG: ion transporter [Mogibacterium sp.]|nr:ion transporter [Mogibacterium sp.]